MTIIKYTLLSLAALSYGICTALADTVTTIDGARLTGSIRLIDQGLIHLDTTYAGTIKIQQSLVSTFQTESPAFFSLSNGTTLTGPVEASAQGKLKIRSAAGRIETELSRIRTAWRSDSQDPQALRQHAHQQSMRRQWKCKGSLDMRGQNGSSDAFGIGSQFDAQLKSPNDTLAFFAEYEQRETEGQTSEDRMAGGASYQSFFSQYYGWYAREEFETDKIDNINFRATSGIGSSYRIINKPHQNLQLRTGLGHRYTDYDNGTDSESSATMDLGLAHSYRYKEAFTLENNLSYIPSLSNWANFTASHDSGIQIPIGTGLQWSIQIGIKNNYDSQSAAEQNLDTSYYTRMVYSWD